MKAVKLLVVTATFVVAVILSSGGPAYTQQPAAPAADDAFSSRSPELDEPRGSDRLLHQGVPDLDEGEHRRVRRPEDGERLRAVHEGEYAAAERSADRDLAFRLARAGFARAHGHVRSDGAEGRPDVRDAGWPDGQHHERHVSGQPHGGAARGGENK